MYLYARPKASEYQAHAQWISTEKVLQRMALLMLAVILLSFLQR